MDELGDREGVANALSRLAILATSQGDRDRAEQFTIERLSLVRQIADLDKEADALRELGDIALAKDDHDRAEELYQNSVEIYQFITCQFYSSYILIFSEQSTFSQ